jgi:hypothetical protein
LQDIRWWWRWSSSWRRNAGILVEEQEEQVLQIQFQEFTSNLCRWRRWWRTLEVQVEQEEQVVVEGGNVAFCNRCCRNS